LSGQGADERGLVGAAADHAQIANSLGQRPGGQSGAFGGVGRSEAAGPGQGGRALQRQLAVKLVGMARRLFEPGAGLAAWPAAAARGPSRKPLARVCGERAARA
jgi:hypothetical protein